MYVVCGVHAHSRPPPSLSQLTANTPKDYDLKFKMLNDVMDVIDLENR